ncbi:MAG: UDP-galactopyranose mutase, partial [Rubripirellula sp.]|nr:UDP-galactopyranose mutase [Rubripirellula sp.]
LFKKLLHGVPLETGADFIADREKLEGKATKIVYTGPLDRLFEYQQGAHDWRGLRFKHRTHDVADYQGVAAVNHTEQEVPYTRTVEHKHFEPVETSHTVVTEEYPASWKVGQEMYYPINDGNSEQLQQQYLKMLPANYIAGGRLASYRYFDMHQVIASALQVAAKEIRYQGSGVVPLRSVSDQRRRAA